MAQTTAVWVHRVLKKMAAYRATTTGEGWLVPIPAEAGPVLGVYRNGEGEEDQVFVADRGLIYHDVSGWAFIAFDALVDIRLPDDKTDDDDRLRVRLANGDHRSIPIMGRRDRFRDVYEFSRFLSRVRDQVARAVGA
jgi:hypothetical protein